MTANNRLRNLETAEQSLAGSGDPNGVENAAEGMLYWDYTNDTLYANTDGATAWQVIGGGGGVPINGQFLVLALSGSLTSERRFVPGDGMQATDGGANADYTLAVDVSDFAGAGLEDDGAENLRIAALAAGDGLTGGGGAALAMDLHADLNANLLGFTGGELDLDSQLENRAFMSPDGAPGKPNFRVLSVADIPAEYVRRDGTLELTADWDAGAHKITAEYLLASCVGGAAVYGVSINSYGLQGYSTNSYGVYGRSAHSIGVYGKSIDSIGVYGESTDSIGVHGESANSYGVYGTSVADRSGYFYRNSATAAAPNFEIVTDHISDTQTVLRVQGDGTGKLVNILDGATEAFTILDGGFIGVNKALPLGQHHIQASSAAVIGQIIQLAAAPSANALEVRAVGTPGAVLANITPGGGAYFSDAVGIETPTPLAPLHVGAGTTNKSSDAMILISRNVDDSGSNNAHAFSDSSIISRSGDISYNSFDARIEFSGANDYGHYASFQLNPSYGSTGTMDNLYGIYCAPHITAGTITQVSHVHIHDAYGSVGVVGLQYGIYIGNLSYATTNYSIYTNDGVVRFGDKVVFTQTDGNEAIDSLDDGHMDYLATDSHRFNSVIRGTSSLWWCCKYIDAFSVSPGLSGATLVPPDRDTLGGYQLNAATEYLYFNGRVCSNWDGATDLIVTVTWEVNVDNSAGNVTDTVDLKLLAYYKGNTDTENKKQEIEIATTVGQAARYKQFTTTFTIDYDLALSIVDVGDTFSFTLNLETDTSEVDDVIVNFCTFSYRTAKMGVEA